MQGSVPGYGPERVVSQSQSLNLGTDKLGGCSLDPDQNDWGSKAEELGFALPLRWHIWTDQSFLRPQNPQLQTMYMCVCLGMCVCVYLCVFVCTKVRQGQDNCAVRVLALRTEVTWKGQASRNDLSLTLENRKEKVKKR